MKIYTIHVNKDHREPLETIRFVQEGGFSVWAGIFQLFWALYNKMWLCAALLFATQATLATIERLDILHPDASLILRAGFFLYVALSANDWYRSSLVHQGYELIDIVGANNLPEAQTRFFSSTIPNSFLSEDPQ